MPQQHRVMVGGQERVIEIPDDDPRLNAKDNRYRRTSAISQAISRILTQDTSSRHELHTEAGHAAEQAVDFLTRGGKDDAGMGLLSLLRLRGAAERHAHFIDGRPQRIITKRERKKERKLRQQQSHANRHHG